MRVTNKILVNNLKNNLSRNIRNIERVQNQLATGKRISKPSEDPTGIVESLRLASRLRQNRQFQENTKDGISWLSTTDGALGSVTSALQRVYELTVQGSNGTLAPEDRKAVKEEVMQIIDEVGNIANTVQGDRYIFGGTNTTEKPYDGVDIDGAVVWKHNEKKIVYEVGVGVEIPINITAKEAFVDADLFGTLQEIATNLESGDTTALSSDIEKINQAMDQILSCRAKAGAGVNRLEMTKERLAEQEINYSTVQAEVDGVDPALVIMQLKNQENIYQASLAVGAKVIMPSLVDFLR
ncbi:MAG: flagellar hook-associated protein FlgL [Clostridia bacterium]|nr:flagellar hook-associated protein FlgL [Clostridia bacterium]MDD4049268.1 flagellar hook-associated protein FlgL [Clostridia bacterium]